ncbi:MAG: hydrolase [Phycisphaerae bacterium]|nr:hydrolase [Phycisphaerae bacterium]
MSFFLQPEDCCLVIVDVQSKLVAVMHKKDELIANICKLVKIANALDIEIVLCQQVPKALGQTVSEISELLPDNQPIDKSSFNCCDQADFNSQLAASGRKQIILCGIETHVCVYQTAVDLSSAGYNVTVVADCVSSRTPENKQLGLDRMQRQNAKISSVEMLLFELLRTSEHPNFRELSKLIK